MSVPASRAVRTTVSESTRPALPRHSRLKFDKIRERWVMLVPERVLVPDETAIEILHLCDGATSVAGIVDTLAQKYAAERNLISDDVIALLQDLADKGYLIDTAEAKR
jgi:pyrroloquinoline quinone biosynthesis protein D